VEKKKIEKFKILLIFLLFSIFLINLNKIFYTSNISISSKNSYDTLKLSFSEDWNRTWDRGDEETGHGIVIDETTGDIYVVGENETSLDEDVLLIKYNSLGEEQWNVTWDNGNREIGYDIALDSDGYIYITGVNGTTFPNFDVFLLKFNSTGVLEWKRIFDGGNYDGAWALEIDSEDKIYISGETITTSYAMLLLKYNSSGFLEWSSIFDGPGYQSGRDLVLDSSNNIYVTGYEGMSAVTMDLLVVKFNSSGNDLWNRTCGGSAQDEGWAITLDSRDNVYTAGFTLSYGAIQRDFFIVKYDCEGNWQWNRTWGTIGSDEARGIGIDSADYIYVGGYTVMSNISIVKYDSSGTLIWYKHWERNPSYDYYSYDLVIDSFDKIYITGYCYEGGGIYNLFLVKFSIESPGGFTLSSDAGVLDTDGNFTLSWTPSPRVSSYSIYQSSSYITEIDDSIIILEEETDDLSLPLMGYSNGTYYFIAVAFNNFGNATSNCIEVEVEIPYEGDGNGDGDDNGDGGGIIPGYNLYMIVILFFSFSAIIFQMKRRKL